jgi:hypothetical protein
MATMRDALVERRDGLKRWLADVPPVLGENLQEEIDALDEEIKLLDANPSLKIDLETGF